MQIVTANRLADGRVVYRDAAGGWADAIAAATPLEPAEAEAAVAAAAADVAARRIVDPYAVEVEIDGANLRPKTMRERIRAAGPTAGTDLAHRPAAEPRRGGR